MNPASPPTAPFSTSEPVAPQQPTPPAPVSPRPARQMTWLGLAVIALLIGGLLWIGFHAKTSPDHTQTPGEVLKGTKLEVDKEAMKVTAQVDVKSLLAKDYATFYHTMGFGVPIADTGSWHDFTTAANALATGGCIFLADDVTTRQGAGLDDQSNSVTVSGPVSCQGADFRLSLEYRGNGAHPEVFKPVSLILSAADNTGFMNAVLQAGGAQVSLTGKDQAVPAHSRTIWPATQSDVAGQVAKLGKDCALDPGVTATLQLKSDVGHKPQLTARVLYTALCTEVQQ